VQPIGAASFNFRLSTFKPNKVDNIPPQDYNGHQFEKGDMAMSIINDTGRRIIDGERLTREDDLTFLKTAPIDELTAAANEIRIKLCGDKVDLCTIINGRSGRCTENCKFCAQSAHNKTGVEEYPMLDSPEIIEACRRNYENGAHRFSIVTAGRALSGEEFEKAAQAYRKMHELFPDMILCASHGLLQQEQFQQLVGCGVTMYHANIETSREYFPNICSSHSFDDKIKCITRAKKAGMSVCSGGIIGMGESWDDRISMALTLAELDIRSIPINVLVPIKGTPLENSASLSQEDILRTIALFSFIVPLAYVRLAAGRKNMEQNGKSAFLSGANAALTGDMLTTSGSNTAQDIAMLKQCGFNTDR
jgi:biotin synthase